jgi:hypothetical protein
LFRNQGGELVADGPGNVRLFPTDSDGQSAAYVSPSQKFDYSDDFALAKVGATIYMTQQSSGKLVQLNNTGNFVKEIVSNLPSASGMVANPKNGHLFIDDAGYYIFDVDPQAGTYKQFLQSVTVNSLAITPDGATLYAAEYYDNHVIGYDTSTGNSKFDSGPITGSPEGIALGTGRFARHLYVSTMDGTLLDIDLASRGQTVIANGGEASNCLTFDPNDDSLLVAQTDRIVRVRFPTGPAASFRIDAPASVLPGQPFVATVAAVDTDGRAIPGYTGTVRLTSSDAYPALLSSEYTFTPSDNSTHNFAAVLFTAGMQVLTARDTANPSLTGSATVVVHAAPATHLKITAPTATVAGSRLDLTAAALDFYGNADPTYTGTVTFTSTDSASGVVLPADYTFVGADKGAHIFSGGVTLLSAGSRTIAVTDKANPNFTASVSLLVMPAPATHLLFAAPSAAVAGTPFAVTVTALDPYGNADSNYTGSVTFRSTDTHPGVLPSDYTFSSADTGTHTFAGVTLFTALPQMLTVQDTGNGSLTVTAAITVNPAPPSQLVILAPATTVTRSPFSITVTVFDPYGNLETNYTGTIKFSSSDSTALLPSDYTYMLADRGTHNFGVVLFALGDQTLTLIDKANGVVGIATITVQSPPAPPGGGRRGSGSTGTNTDSLPALSAPSGTQTVLSDWFFASVNDETTVAARPQNTHKALDVVYGTHAYSWASKSSSR